MQGANTSKTILPCGRRVHLHKSASLKKVFEQTLTNQRNEATNDHKMIGTST